MRYEPHEYQKFTAEYIEAHPVSAIFLDCGLGKTSITLTAVSNLMFDSFEIHRVLVVAPIRVASYSWPAEIEKWDHLEGLKYSVAVGTAAERLAEIWGDMSVTVEVAAENLRAFFYSMELALAVHLARVFKPVMVRRYQHTKKKRTRKKYEKRILAWFGEVWGKCSD